MEGKEDELPKLVKVLEGFKERNPEVKIVMSDLKDSSNAFSLISDDFDNSIVKTARLINYSRLYEEQRNRIFTL